MGNYSVRDFVPAEKQFRKKNGKQSPKKEKQRQKVEQHFRGPGIILKYENSKEKIPGQFTIGGTIAQNNYCSSLIPEIVFLIALAGKLYSQNIISWPGDPVPGGPGSRRAAPGSPSGPGGPNSRFLPLFQYPGEKWPSYFAYNARSRSRRYLDTPGIDP